MKKPQGVTVQDVERAQALEDKTALLYKAIELLEKRKSHGNETKASLQRFTSLGKMWEAMLASANGGVEVKITPELAALMCAALKLNRACYSENEDNYLDAVAYLALAADYKEKTK